MTDTKINSDGFSLIELSVVIMILGIIITPIFGIISQNQKLEERREEEHINQRVLSALAAYLKEEGQYPCPASPTAAPGEAAFGNGICGGIGNCGTLTSVNGASTPANKVCIGTLPIKQLNLPLRAAINSKDWKYIYAVTEKLTETTYDGAGEIRINDTNGNSFLVDRAGGIKYAHFVIVNPGIDGKGAYTLFGGGPGVACGNTAADSENCDTDSIFVENVINMNGDPTTSSNYYDDVIAYSLALEESTMWMVRKSAPGAATGTLDIINRNTGNIGIGTATPTEKVHIQDGNLKVEGAGATIESEKVESSVYYYK